MAPLSKRTTTTAVSSSPRSRHSGSTSASAVAYTSTASAPGLRNRSVSKSWIRVSLKIVSGGDPGRVEAAGVAGHRAQQPRGAQPAVVEQRAGGRPVRGEPPVEPDLQHDAGGAGGVDRPVRVGQRQRHRLLAEHRLAGAGRGHHQVGVEAGRRGDHHRVDLRVGEHLAPGRCTRGPRPAPRPAAPPRPAPGRPPRPAAPPGSAGPASRRGTTPSAPTRSGPPRPSLPSHAPPRSPRTF